MDSKVTIIDFPQALHERFGNTVSFSTIAGIYWDGMDWCQYDEVLPSPHDIEVIQASHNESDLADDRTFFAQ